MRKKMRFLLLILPVMLALQIIGRAQTDFNPKTEIVGSQEKIVKGAPFSADAISESVQLMFDGNKIVRTVKSGLFRDGCLYNRWGKFKEAVEMLEKSRRLQPDYSETLINLGYAFMQQKQFREAVSVVREVVKRNPNDLEAQYFLGKLYLLAKDKQSALTQYGMIKSLNPQIARQLYEFIYRDKLLVIRQK